MSSKAGKRPLRSMTAHEKLVAIRRVHEGESKASVARDIGVPESTLRGWCKNEDKISYLSRQSSPETDESAAGIEPKEKKIKLDDVYQPYNLSKKCNSSNHSPVSDFAKNDFDASKPLNLNVKPEREKERNRAELARLSVELGLNRPEMFLPTVNSGSTICDYNSNMGLLIQWNNLLMQQQKTINNISKVTAPADTSSNLGSYRTTESTPPKLEVQPKYKPSKLPKAEKTSDEAVLHWIKTHPSSVLGLTQNQNGVSVAPTVSSTSNVQTVSSSSTSCERPTNMFWQWYKGLTDCYPFRQNVPDKPILYQQLTKDKDSHNTENISVEDKTAIKNNRSKMRSVLDTVLYNYNNNNLDLSKRDSGVNQCEALKHAEKFLEWLEHNSGEQPVTLMQILQLKFLVETLKGGKKNESQTKRVKVKRK